MEALIAMFTCRPAVVANVTAFLFLAGAERGVPRTLAWLVTGTLIGWLMEFSSIRTGFPFGTYSYHARNFPDELWIADVPLFASLSFAALTYFGYSAAYTLLSPLRRVPGGLERLEDPTRANSWKVLLLSCCIITWMDLVIDPVTHLGRYWMLGDLYHYDPPGIHFDVPLSNYGGWILTGFCIVLVNQILDRLLRRGGHVPGPGLRLPYRPLWPIGCQLGTYLFMLGTTIYLMTVPSIPDEVPLEGILASGASLTGIYAAFVLLMIRRGLRRGMKPGADPTAAGEAMASV